jgi:serine protease Do
MMLNFSLQLSRCHRIFFFTMLILLNLTSSSGCAEQQQDTAGEKASATSQSTDRKDIGKTAAMAIRSSSLEKQKPLDMFTAIERVAEDNIPAVVHVEVTERLEIEHPLLPYREDPVFRKFFGSPQEIPEKLEQEVQSIGSGMIMDRHGHILTNYHVVSGANNIEVLLASGHHYPARLIGGDAKTDLAVLHIAADIELPHVLFGDSDDVKVGEWVVAIGHPRGLTQTVTQGIISAKHRTGLIDPSNYQDFLQTDAAINPGNSGGPLLNLQGEVIGVNAAIATMSGGFEGIGFAIPSNMALFVAKQLIEKGEVRRGWLGVNVQDVTPDLVEELGLKQPDGAMVAGVIENSPAARAGLEAGDVIISYQNRKVTDAATLRNEVAVTAIDEQVPLTVWRQGAEKQISIRIGSQEEAEEQMTSSAEEQLGAKFRPISPETAARLGLEQGVEIAAIRPGGLLAEAGFEVGDLLLAIEDQPVDSPEALAIILSIVPPGQPITILAIDSATGQIGYVQIELN